MLELTLLVTYAYFPTMGSISIQQAAVPSSPTCELIADKPPFLATTKDETALAPNAGIVGEEPKISVTSRFSFLSNVKPKKLGNAGPGACLIVGLPALSLAPTGNT